MVALSCRAVGSPCAIDDRALACLETFVAIATVEAGESLREAARRVGRPYTAIQRLVAAYGDRVERRRKPRLADRTKRRIASLVAEEILSVREIAREVGVSPDSVWQIARKIRPNLPEPTHARKVDRYRCACGHLVDVAPCVICAAKAAAA